MGLEAAPLSREQTLHIALGMGKALLKNGAETSRVEDTISRFCHTHGYHDIHVFVTPTVIILGDEEKTVSKVVMALDGTKAAADYAKSVEADLLLTHHPIIFIHVKKIV